MLDVLLPDISGLVLVNHLVDKGFQGHIVVMTFLKERSYVEQALQAGAKRLIQKGSADDNLLIAIRSAMLGGLFFDPPTASEILVPSTPPSGPSALGTPLLTTREEEVLRPSRSVIPTRKLPTVLLSASSQLKPTRRAPLKK